MLACYLFDIDGTLTNGDHRIHHIRRTDGKPKDWEAFHAECHLDTPIQHMVDLCITIQNETDIVFLTGRPEKCRDATLDWLSTYGLWGELYMRPDGDYRNDDILKIEMLEKIRADGWHPVMAFEDRTRVVKAYRAAGLPCAQVAEGDF